MSRLKEIQKVKEIQRVSEILYKIHANNKYIMRRMNIDEDRINIDRIYNRYRRAGYLYKSFDEIVNIVTTIKLNRIQRSISNKKRKFNAYIKTLCIIAELKNLLSIIENSKHINIIASNKIKYELKSNINKYELKISNQSQYYFDNIYSCNSNLSYQ